MVYLLDANVFIEAARHYYAFDLAPKFWDSLENLAVQGQLHSIDWVGRELERGKDDLAIWAKQKFSQHFVVTDDEHTINRYADIMTWVQGQGQFSEAQKTRFAKGADGWLIAFATANGLSVVTQEVIAPLASTKVKIPNVCQAFGVPYVNTFDMLKSLGVRFD